MSLRRKFGPKLSGFVIALPPTPQPGDPSSRADLEIGTPDVRVRDAETLLVDVPIPAHDPATTNLPVAVHAVFSKDDPTEADDPTAWLAAEGHYAGMAAMPSELDGSSSSVTIAVKAPLATMAESGWTCQTILDFAE